MPKAMLNIEGQLTPVESLIEHEGGLWAAPYWIDSPAEKVSRPSRIIRIDSLPHRTLKGNTDVILVVEMPIPKSLWEKGQIPQGSIFEVVESPPIEAPMRDGDTIH